MKVMISTEGGVINGVSIPKKYKALCELIGLTEFTVIDYDIDGCEDADLSEVSIPKLNYKEKAYIYVAKIDFPKEPLIIKPLTKDKE